VGALRAYLVGALLLGLVIGLPATSPLTSAEPVIDPDVPSLVNQGYNYTLRGYENDLNRDVYAYQWSSTQDGIIGTTQNVTTADLSPGNHTISFNVQDTDGNWSDPAETQLKVNGRPNATIITPEATNFTEGDDVTFFADSSDTDGEVISYNWDSNIDGFVGDSKILNVATLSAGDHLLSLDVADDLGARSMSFTTSIHINARPTIDMFSIVMDSWSDDNAYNDGQYSYSLGLFDNNQYEASHNSNGSTETLTLDYAKFHYKAASNQAIQVQEQQDLVLQAEASDEDGDVVAYRWSSDIDGLVSEEPELEAERLTPGAHLITFQVQDDEGAWSYPAVMELEVVPQAHSSDDGATMPAPVVGERQLYSGILVSMVIILGTSYLYTDETTRYKLSNTLVPLTTNRRRRRGEDPLAHETRSMIKGALLMQPGAHYSLLKDKLKLNNGTLAHHLRVMEKEELVKSQKMGHLRCFYLAGQRNGMDRDKLPLTAIQEQAIEQVSLQPGITQRRLAAALKITPAAVKYQADKLIAQGLISRRRDGLAVRYDLLDPQPEPTLDDPLQVGHGCADL